LVNDWLTKRVTLDLMNHVRGRLYDARIRF
jgi:hypothetical protein